MGYLSLLLNYIRLKYTGTMFLLTVLGGLTMYLFDQAEMIRMGRAREARFARTAGLLYMVVGVALWIVRLLAESLD